MLVSATLHHKDPRISKFKNRVADDCLQEYSQFFHELLGDLDAAVDSIRKKVVKEIEQHKLSVSMKREESFNYKADSDLKIKVKSPVKNLGKFSQSRASVQIMDRMGANSVQLSAKGTMVQLTRFNTVKSESKVKTALKRHGS